MGQASRPLGHQKVTVHVMIGIGKELTCVEGVLYVNGGARCQYMVATKPERSDKTLDKIERCDMILGTLCCVS